LLPEEERKLSASAVHYKVVVTDRVYQENIIKISELSQPSSSHLPWILYAISPISLAGTEQKAFERCME